MSGELAGHTDTSEWPRRTISICVRANETFLEVICKKHFIELLTYLSILRYRHNHSGIMAILLCVDPQQTSNNKQYT